MKKLSPQLHQPQFKCSGVMLPNGYSIGKCRYKIFPSLQKILLDSATLKLFRNIHCCQTTRVKRRKMLGLFHYEKELNCGITSIWLSLQLNTLYCDISNQSSQCCSTTAYPSAEAQTRQGSASFLKRNRQQFFRHCWPYDQQQVLNSAVKFESSSHIQYVNEIGVVVFQ